jgi:hypothetical protein
MPTYNVLWIDDKHEGMSSFKATARRYDLTINAFKSANGGMSELEANYSHYDAVLLDAKILEDETDAPGTESTRYIHQAKARLDAIPKKFDTFVYTGQVKAYANETFEEVFGRENIYQKGVEAERTRLFENLRRSAADSEDANLRNKYATTLAVCTDDYLGQITHPEMIKLLKALERNTLGAEHLNQIRNIVERAMTALQESELLPYEITALNAQSRFLCGLDSESNRNSRRPSFILHNDNLPLCIHRGLIRALVETIQQGSHAEELDTFIKTSGNDFWPKATLYQLMAFIEWFKLYTNSEPRMNQWQPSPQSRR